MRQTSSKRKYKAIEMTFLISMIVLFFLMSTLNAKAQPSGVLLDSKPTDVEDVQSSTIDYQSSSSTPTQQNRAFIESFLLTTQAEDDSISSDLLPQYQARYFEATFRKPSKYLTIKQSNNQYLAPLILIQMN